MPHIWSRLHEHLVCPPGPLSFEMVRRCVDGGLAEADDWIGRHSCRTCGTSTRLSSSDAAAMANTRGGLIVCGVTEQVEFSGIDPAAATPDPYAQWIRNLVQPYLSGLETYVLSSAARQRSKRKSSPAAERYVLNRFQNPAIAPGFSFRGHFSLQIREWQKAARRTGRER